MSDPTIDLYRSMFANVHGWLDGTVGAMTPEQLAWQPPARVVPAAAHYAHALFAEDAVLRLFVQGQPPILMGDYTADAGISEPPPTGQWDEWARTVQIDLAKTQPYAQAVYASTDAYLASLTAPDTENAYDFSALGWGDEPLKLGHVLHQLVANVAAHTGEISAIKGLQGLQGYPF